MITETYKIRDGASGITVIVVVLDRCYDLCFLLFP